MVKFIGLTRVKENDVTKDYERFISHDGDLFISDAECVGPYEAIDANTSVSEYLVHALYAVARYDELIRDTSAASDRARETGLPQLVHVLVRVGEAEVRTMCLFVALRDLGFNAVKSWPMSEEEQVMNDVVHPLYDKATLMCGIWGHRNVLRWKEGADTYVAIPASPFGGADIKICYARNSTVLKRKFQIESGPVDLAPALAYLRADRPLYFSVNDYFAFYIVLE